MPRLNGWTPLAALAALLMAGVAAPAQDVRYPFGAFGKYTPEGMLVLEVKPDSPASRAGLQRGDLILKLDGRLITNQDDLVAAINSSGGTLVLIVKKASSGTVVRQVMDLTGKRGVRAPYLLGVLGRFTPDGMVINTVGPDTPASKAGLQPGDIILRINDLFIANQLDYFTVLNNSGGEVKLTVRKGRGGRVLRLEADLRVYRLGVVGDFTPQGMVIDVVAPGTPADFLGIMRGDIILQIDNRPVRSQREFDTLINNSGGTVVLTLRKGLTGEVGRLLVELMNNPLGAWCEPVADGLRVTAVPPGSSAMLAGLMRGDVILKVDDQRVKTMRELVCALQDSSGLPTLTVRQAATGRIVKIDVDLTR